MRTHLEVLNSFDDIPTTSTSCISQQIVSRMSTIRLHDFQSHSDTTCSLSSSTSIALLLSLSSHTLLSLVLVVVMSSKEFKTSRCVLMLIL